VQAICRTVGSGRSRAAAISACEKPKTSRSTNTARSTGLRVSSTTIIAVETVSAISASVAASGVVSSGSGSHGPT
jgi:hypothetical protein